MFSLFTFAVLLAFASAQVEVTLCSDTLCKEPPLAIVHLNSTSGCQTDFSGYKVLGIATNQTTLGDAQNTAVRFYRSNDCFATCGSGHLIAQTLGGRSFQSLRRNPVLQSFELVDVDEDGTYAPHGYCGIRHGDAQCFRGQTWKWRQIGRNAFREIPIKEWDDTVHVRQTSREYDWHGSVDAKGEFKWQQITDNGWSGVKLEEWDDEVNVRRSGTVPVIDPSGKNDL